MIDLRDLIERLEKASGPSRELDIEIAIAVGHRSADFGTDPYTASIDAALSLVPDGWRWRMGHTSFAPCNEAQLWASVAPIEKGKLSMVVQGVEGANPALALCIAALKAREAPSV